MTAANRKGLFVRVTASDPLLDKKRTGQNYDTRNCRGCRRLVSSSIGRRWRNCHNAIENFGNQPQPHCRFVAKTVDKVRDGICL